MWLRQHLQFVGYALLMSTFMGIGFAYAQQGAVSTPPSKNATAAAAPGVLLSYSLRPGTTQRYLITAYFDGHFPPFDQPGDPPVHLLAHMQYVAQVGQPQQDGVPVDFSVTQVDMQLLQKEVPVGAKIDPKQVVPFPIELEQAQKALNTKVVLRPDGSIARILSAPNNLVRVNVGIDLRKLFMMVMPVILPDTTVTLGATWTSKEGLIGAPPAKVSYTNKVTAMKPTSGDFQLKVQQIASSQIEDTLDASGLATTNKQQEASLLQGSASFAGWMSYVGMPTPNSAGEKSYAVQLHKGFFRFQAKLKRTPIAHSASSSAAEAPTAPTGNIEVAARFVVQALGQTAQR